MHWSSCIRDRERPQAIDSYKDCSQLWSALKIIDYDLNKDEYCYELILAMMEMQCDWSNLDMMIFNSSQFVRAIK